MKYEITTKTRLKKETLGQRFLGNSKTSKHFVILRTYGMKNLKSGPQASHE